MRPLLTATLYFGSFIALGYIARRLIDRWMVDKGIDLADVQDQAGENRRKQSGFLLGIWYWRRD